MKFLPSWFPGLEFPQAATELDVTYRDMMELPFSAVEQSFVSFTRNWKLHLSFRDLVDFERVEIRECDAVFCSESP